MYSDFEGDASQNSSNAHEKFLPASFCATMQICMWTRKSTYARDEAA
jgi:hypothetical protein